MLPLQDGLLALVLSTIFMVPGYIVIRTRVWVAAEPAPGVKEHILLYLATNSVYSAVFFALLNLFGVFDMAFAAHPSLINQPYYGQYVPRLEGWGFFLWLSYLLVVPAAIGIIGGVELKARALRCFFQRFGYAMDAPPPDPWVTFSKNTKDHTKIMVMLNDGTIIIGASVDQAVFSDRKLNAGDIYFPKIYEETKADNGKNQWLISNKGAFIPEGKIDYIIFE
tara:strand:+ start:211 stop:879 length:669 start_codon:yes stop_codon:yes gene_type:complete